MMRALWSAASGMTAQQLSVDTIANNLANVNTTGFKRSRVDFQDLLYQTMRVPGSVVAEGAQIPTGIQVGLGARAAATQKMFEQGDFQQTEAPFDLVIEGDGFFQILRPDGSIAYTRAGSFKLDGNGSVVTSDGYSLEPATVIPPDAISVSVGTDGTVSCYLAGEAEPQVLGNIQLVKFANPAGLLSIGRSLYETSAASGQPTTGTPGLDGFGTISQGYLEMSNVKVVEEMVNMIVAQRAYEANSKAIQIADEMLQTANNTRR